MNAPAVRRVMVVDDEPPAVERMVALLGAQPGVEVVGCESRPDRVVERCRQLNPDLVFLDIEMPGTPGLELARALRRLDRPPAIVFVTAHPDYAVQAFDVAALDYLVKPVRTERLRTALDAGCQLALVCAPDSVPRALDALAGPPPRVDLSALYGRARLTLAEQELVPEFRAWKLTLKNLAEETRV